MEQIKNWEKVKASDGGFDRPSAGGYICKIIDVEDVPLDANTGKGNYLRISYDIADGEFKDYFKEQNDRWGGDWIATFIRSYKEKAQGMFKHFINCVEQSNNGFAWDWSEKELVGEFVGLVLGEEEYENKKGEIKTKLVVKDVKTAFEIKEGNFKIPPIKKLERTQAQNDNGFSPIDNVDTSDLPF